ncbi:MAG: DUF4097 family beta strand repeat-containing protein [Phycisphaerales bacterium]
MRHNLSLILGLLLVASLGACSIHFGQTARSKVTSFTQSIQHVSDAPVEIRTRNGSVDIAAEQSLDAVSIEAKIVCGGKTKAEAEERVAQASLTVIRRADQSLLIAPSFPGGPQNGDGASIWVKLPDARGVEIYTSNGSVSSSGLTGEIVIDTSNGRVELADHHGTATIETSNGRVIVRHLLGDLHADTSNGPIEVIDLAGSANLDTSNGSVFVSLASGQAGPIIADSSNGPITVKVGPTFVGTVTMDTSNGPIIVDDPVGVITSRRMHKSEGRLVVGEGGATTRLDTSNAAIKFIIQSEG